MKTSGHHHAGLWLAFLLLFLFQADLRAATKYVSNSGNNSNSGNSWAQAWLTLQYGADHIGAGDTLWIQNGTYVGFDFRTTGSAANPVVFIAAGNNVVINVHNPVTTDGINIEDADYVEINGVRVINQPRNGIRLALANHCIVRNCYCSNSQKRGIFTGFTDDLLLEYNECLSSIDEHGIYVSNSSDRSIIRFNTCHNNHGGGIQINADGSQGGDGISTDPKIYGNIIYENGVGGGAGINLDGVQGAFIYNNLLYNNHASGIALFQLDGNAPSINAKVIHNTIINSSDARWSVLIVNGATGAQVYNNILINQHPWKGSIALDPDAIPGFNSDYNVLVNSLSNNGDGNHITFAAWQALGYDAHSMLAAPLADIFVAPGSGDYHLLNNAQAVNTGNSNFAFGVNVDLDGVTRPQGSQNDIGAYEALGTLAIDEDGRPAYPHPKKIKDILITSESISWPFDLEGDLYIFNIEGQLITALDLAAARSYSFEALAPGVYIACIRDQRYAFWSRGFFVK
ncbi:MAG TPA: right-handed parallel beta-helix repeat-containing protein [Saprospiraceae bacterium]|nr:right-handed parallel beta-helix repeat-containing protein [Saprospiraceae bacterium]